MGYCMGQMGLDVRDRQIGQNEHAEQSELAQDGRLPYEFMPVTNWGRKPNGAEMVQYDAPMFFSFTEHSLLHQFPTSPKNLVSHHRHSSRARSSSTCIRRPQPTGGICSSRPWTSYAIAMRLPQCWRRLLGQLRCGGGSQRRAGSPNASQGQAQTDERYREHCHQSG